MKFPERLTVDGIERPARNSAGAAIHPSIEGVRNFWRWFGESQVVDAAGRPLVLYHGTTQDFDAFKVLKKKGMFGQGVYLTSNPSLADGFAESRGGNAMPVYARQADTYKKVLYLVSDPAQIKSALGNSGAFDPHSTSLIDNHYPALTPFPSSVFHGTSAVFSAFDISHADADEGGIFFTDSRAQAAEYGHRLLQAAVSLRHPFVADYAAWQWGDVPDPSSLKAAGHDGVILLDFDAQAGGAVAATAWCVFDAATIELLGEPQVLPARCLVSAKTPSIPDEDPVERYLVVTVAPDRQAFTEQDAELEVARLLRAVAELPDWSGDYVDTAALPLTVMVDGIERPTRNGAGVPIHPLPEGVRNFWRWFGDGQAVDDQGRPLVVYHGTTKDFEMFDPARSKTTGSFFSVTPEYANIVAELDGARDGGARVMPAYVRLDNPAFVSSESFQRADTRHAVAAGHDGLITLSEGSPSQITVFDGAQVKSALGNSGAFDAGSLSLTDDHASLFDCAARPHPVALSDVNGQRVGHVAICSVLPAAPEGAFQVVIALPVATSLSDAHDPLWMPARGLLCSAADRVARGDRSFLLATDGVVQLALNGPSVSFDDDLTWANDGVRVLPADATFAGASHG